MNALIAPSILASDFSEIKQTLAVLQEANADWIHLDVMDGNFVPNITFGPQFVKNIRAHTNIPFDAHLMITNADFFAPRFIDAGAEMITVHVEGNAHLQRTLVSIREKGAKAGVAFNPHTPLNALDYVMNDIDHILIMSVNPGFGGQPFIEGIYPKITDARERIEKSGRPISLAVDGGVTLENAARVRDAGADFLVVGTALMSEKNIRRAIETLRG